MPSLRFTIAIILIVMSPCMGWAQASVESIPNLEPSTSIIKPNFISKFYSYFIFVSLGALVIASGIWYNIYTRRHQHPYQFLETTEKSVEQLVEEGSIEEAIELLVSALQTIENNPQKFPVKCQSRNGAIWMIKRKIEELKELLIDH